MLCVRRDRGTQGHPLRPLPRRVRQHLASQPEHMGVSIRGVFHHTETRRELSRCPESREGRQRSCVLVWLGFWAVGQPRAGQRLRRNHML